MRHPIVFQVIHQISRSHGQKNRFKSSLSRITRPFRAIKSLRFALLHNATSITLIIYWNVLFVRPPYIRDLTVYREFKATLTTCLGCHNLSRQQRGLLAFNSLRPRQIHAISQTTFSNAFSWMKMNEFRLGYHWSSFLSFESTIFHNWFR